MARILFIDDDYLTLSTLSKAVTLFGHEALQAGSEKKATRIAREEQPDLILLDMNLENTSGLHILKKLHADPLTASIPVIMLSASPEIDASDIAIQAGAQAYLLKPVRLNRLLEVIREYTSS